MQRSSVAAACSRSATLLLYVASAASACWAKPLRTRRGVTGTCAPVPSTARVGEVKDSGHKSHYKKYRTREHLTHLGSRRVRPRVFLYPKCSTHTCVHRSCPRHRTCITPPRTPPRRSRPRPLRHRPRRRPPRPRRRPPPSRPSPAQLPPPQRAPPRSRQPPPRRPPCCPPA